MASVHQNTIVFLAIMTDPDPARTRALVEAGYNHAASPYLAFSLKHAATSGTPRDAYLDQLLSNLSAPHNDDAVHILELGCGAGVLCTRTLLERGHTVTAVDISSAQIDLAKANLQPFLTDTTSPRLTLLNEDMTSLSFRPSSFSAIVAFYSLFHLPKPDQRAAIRNIARWLKPGGWFLCNLQTDDSDITRDDWMGAKMFSTGFGVQGNSEMLRTEGVGLKIVLDKVVVETIGRMEERFQWVLAVKEGL